MFVQGMFFQGFQGQSTGKDPFAFAELYSHGYKNFG